MNAVSSYISSKRKVIGLTQQQIAEKLNVSFQAVSKWENGTTFPNTELLTDLSDLLGVTVDEMLRGKDSDNSGLTYSKAGVDIHFTDAIKREMNNSISTEHPRVLNGLCPLSIFWFDYTKDIVKNHVVSINYNEYPNEFRKDEYKGRSMLVKKINMLPVECIVRGYLAGSAWLEYIKTGCICEIQLPGGLRESQKFETPLFTTSIKAEIGQHDENVSFEKACDILGRDLAEKVKNKSIELYHKCADYALSKGIIIADTKFEFGLDENDELILGDEIFTPDSSRFCPLDKYEAGRVQDSFDKQFLRDWLKENGYISLAPPNLPENIIKITKYKYLDAYRILTGKQLDC
ncbi:MAG: phosphoribosylaminoimidazolesuccinocarboxamide synthase [Bacillota bacterium]|nr:phosphoribosylaminoimidazolesuccinocarboxamide synthase [Bacillota bacterium]